ncbi:hypothetical protein ACLKQF_02585 [Aeromonas salmonicida]
MGRKSFLINPKTLKALREEAGFTQHKLMLEAYTLLGRSPNSSPKTLTTQCQRIEKLGHTSKLLANALATVLDTSVEVLQGESMIESYSYKNKIFKQLQAQLAQGMNKVLEREIKEWVEWDGLRGNEPLITDEIIDELARELGVRIELAQLTGQEAELDCLRELTGWSNEQLFNPANVHGHWFIRTTQSSYVETSIKYGLGQVFEVVHDVIDKAATFGSTDMEVIVQHRLPWISIDLKHPTVIQYPKTSVIFSRALPKPEGLKWVSPTTSDQWYLRDLKVIAFQKANFVTLNDNVRYPADVRNLRLKVVELVDYREVRTAYTEGFLHELSDQCFQKFLREGSSHNLIVNLLFSGLAQGLCSRFICNPEKVLKIKATQNSIVLEFDRFKLSREQRQSATAFSNIYKIFLVEETQDGEYREAPWVKNDIDKAALEFKTQLQREWQARNSLKEEDGVVLHFKDVIL